MRSHKKSPSSRGFHLSQEITRNQRAMAQQQDIAQQPKRITHISKFMLCRLVVFVNARSCFNSCIAASLAGTRNTDHCASRLRSTLARMDLAAHGALLARCKPPAATAPPIAVSPTQPAVSASMPDSSWEGLNGSSGALAKLLGADCAINYVPQILLVVLVPALATLQGLLD